MKHQSNPTSVLLYKCCIDVRLLPLKPKVVLLGIQKKLDIFKFYERKSKIFQNLYLILNYHVSLGKYCSKNDTCYVLQAIKNGNFWKALEILKKSYWEIIFDNNYFRFVNLVILSTSIFFRPIYRMFQFKEERSSKLLAASRQFHISSLWSERKCLWVLTRHIFIKCKKN